MANLTRDQRAARDLAQRIERDRKMICTPDDWPKWPCLPLKRRDGDTLHHNSDYTCFMLSGAIASLKNGGKVVVYFDNMWRTPAIAEEIMKETGVSSVTWGQICAKLRSKTFDDLDSLLAEYTVD